MAETHALRTDAFSQLLPAALDTLELSQRIAVEDDVQHRQAVVQSTSQLKERFTAAKQIAQNLPGGDLSIAEQDELISLLERLRDERLKLLHIFSTTPVSTANRLS